MKPIEFDKQNVILGEGQEEYQNLPAHVNRQIPEVPVIQCWELSADDIIAINTSGKLWISQYTFGGGLQPILITTKARDHRFEQEIEGKPAMQVIKDVNGTLYYLKWEWGKIRKSLPDWVKLGKKRYDKHPEAPVGCQVSFPSNREEEFNAIITKKSSLSWDKKQG